jgi:plasmid stability protein
MNRLIQIRNVPDKLHRRLKARAALAGLSLSDYILAEIATLADRPTREELAERLAQRSAVRTKVSPTRAVRAERDGR